MDKCRYLSTSYDDHDITLLQKYFGILNWNNFNIADVIEKNGEIYSSLPDW